MEIGIPIVDEYEVSDPPTEEELTGIEYPVVVKPVDGTGNKGLSICYNKAELIKGCEKARNSGSGNILVERYVTGEETWNYYYLADGEIRYAYSGRVFRQPGYPTFLYSFGTSALRTVQEYKVKLNEKCIAFLKAIGCRKGIAWFQFIRDENGRYYALEMAQRISADSAGKSAKIAAGVNDLEWMLDVAFGKDHSIDELPQPFEPPYKNSQCVYYLFADRSGTVSSMQGLDELDKSEFQISVLAHSGSYVDKYRNMVRIVFNARNGNDMCDKLRLINNNIRILDEKGDNMYIQFTDYEEVAQSTKGLFLHA